MVKTPSNTALNASPGMPRVRRGIMAPAGTALFPASAARQPSGVPLPNSSGCFDDRLAASYDMKEARMRHFVRVHSDDGIARRRAGKRPLRPRTLRIDLMMSVGRCGEEESYKKKGPASERGLPTFVPAFTQPGMTLVAHGPLRPSPTVNSTFWPSSREA